MKRIEKRDLHYGLHLGLFCKHCIELATCDGLPSSNGITLGCVNCAIYINKINDLKIDTRTLTEFEFLRWTNYIGCWTINELRHNVCVQNALNSLFEKHERWKLPVVNRLAKECVPLVIVTRQGLITVTVARYILLMIGNELMNPFEVFDKIVRTPQRQNTLLKFSF